MSVTNTIDLEKVGIWMNALGKKTIMDAANHLKERAIYHAPEDTGWLKSSISVTVSPGESIVQVNALAFYAQYVEFGHLTTSGSFVPPNPFFARAFEDTKIAFPNIAQTAVATLPYGSHETGAFGLQGQEHMMLGVSFTAQM